MKQPAALVLTVSFAPRNTTIRLIGPTVVQEALTVLEEFKPSVLRVTSELWSDPKHLQMDVKSVLQATIANLVQNTLCKCLVHSVTTVPMKQPTPTHAQQALMENLYSLAV